MYQHNVYAKGSKFYSFKKVFLRNITHGGYILPSITLMLNFLLQVMAEMGAPISGMEVASFMSCSKGYMGECGMRCQLNTLG